MPFLYVYICDVLEKLAELIDRPLVLGLKEKTNTVAIKWLGQHRSRLNEESVDSPAVVRMLYPEQRAEWDFELDAESIEQLIARVLNLPRNLYDDLQMWRDAPAHGDLGACVERVMNKMTWELATRAVANKVTVEEIDQALLKIASHNPKSSPQIQSLAKKVKTHDSIELLGRFYRSLGGREAKWLTRSILKDYGAVRFPNRLDFSPHNAFLPRCVQMNAEVSISDAIPALRDGTSVIRGTFSTISAANTLPKSPMIATERKTGAVASTQTMVDQPPTPPTPALQPSSSAPTPSHHPDSQSREPLGSLEANTGPSSQAAPTKAYEPSSSTPALPSTSHLTKTKAKASISSSQPTSQHMINTRSSQHSQTSQTKSSLPMTISGTGICRLTSHRCPLTNCIFVLSPCISTSPYILENLLPWHGSHIVSSIRGFSEPLLPRYCPQTGKKYRKIALVEPNRTAQTIEFLKRIEKLNLRRRKGEKQWVEVYDWRILECVFKVDRGEKLAYNLWRRCWMGAV